jgi:CCR4-NOT transcription complex subunit 3
MLQNETLAVEEVAGIREDLEYYIDYNQEDDFIENEQLYDDLDLVEGGAAISREAQSSPEPSAEDPEVPSGPSSGLNSATSNYSGPNASVSGAMVGSQPHNQPSYNPPPNPAPSLPIPTPKAPSTSATAAPSPWATAKISEVLLKAKKEALPSAPRPSSANAPSMAAAAAADLALSEDAAPLAAQMEKTCLSQEVTPIATADSAPSSPPYAFQRLKALLKAGTANPVVVASGVAPSFTQQPPADIYEFERNKPYSPTNPCTREQHPPHYPANPPSLFEANESIYQKFDLDTLFFIFYYLPRTLPQYYAARELKRQSWRFHKKFLTWFQRWEEPKVVNDDWEQGTYVYFDYEGGAWSQRKKVDFTFEYRYLEDVELV